MGVTRVELRANGSLLATDITAPYQFAWDTTNLANGNASLLATAFDAAGNSKASSSVTVYVSNATTVVADTTPPVVTISNPVNGGKVSGNVAVKVSATDNAGTSTLRQTLYINGKSVATATGGALNYSWNTRKVAAGNYTLQAVAVDAAGNSSSVQVGVTR